VTAFADDSTRRLIPRWRYSFSTDLTAEHTGLARRGRLQPESTPALDAAESRFVENPTLVSAAELVACGAAYQEPTRAYEAALYLLERRGEVRAAVARQAEWITGAPLDVREPHTIASGADLSSARTAAEGVIRTRRAQLELWPRDPIGWIDLARAYAVIGQVDKARRAVNAALQLAPNHRVVLRVAARFAFHSGRPDEAYARISRHPRTRSDPWLMSSELALAQIVDRSPRFCRAARAILEERSHAPGHLSELAGAAATLDLGAGKHRRARSLFRQSLEDPTENALAQVEWARKTDSSLSIPEKALEVPYSYEANYWRARRAADWNAALAGARDWLLDEPYSSRPAIFGSSIAAMALHDYPLAEEFARAGLVADSRDNSLWNNLAVALAKRDRPWDAARAFSKIEMSPESSLPRFVANATRGLIAFRLGQPEIGRRWYDEADTGAPDGEMRKLVLLHWAAEELRLAPARARQLLERTAYDEGATADPLIAQLRDGLERQLESGKSDEAVHPPPDGKPALAGPT